jgi:glycolate oxidase FAD binding subunit
MATIRASYLLTQALQLRGDTNGFLLDIQLNAHPEAKQSEILAQMAQSLDLKIQGSTDEVWRARESLFAKSGCAIKATMMPDSVTTLAEDVRRLGGTSVSQALGLMYANFPDYRTGKPLDSLFAYVDAASGSLTILSDPYFFGDELAPPWGKKEVDPLMQAVKHQFDPNRTLNPGRFLGGI